MNNLKIVEGGVYKVEDGMFTKYLYVIKKVRFKHRLRTVDGITYSNNDVLLYEQTMTEKEFHRIALYQIS